MRFGLGIASLMLSGLAACTTGAATPQDPAGVVQMRVLVKLQDASSDPLVLARQASAIAGVPVRYVSAASPRWHALTLECASSAECDAALQRLRADDRAFAEVERDMPKRAGS
jgi:hypothetical protein